MNRSTLIALVGLFATACSSSPTTPTAPRTGAPQIATSAASAFAAGSPALVDLAHCLQSAGDPACFSGARPITRVTTAGATAPGAPTGFSATVNGTSVTMTWSAPASGDPVVTYIIEAGSSSGLVNLANLATGSSATTFSSGGVPNGTYFVRVKAQNAAGTSAASNEAILVVGATACTSAPNPPTGLASTVTASTIALTWTAPSGSCAPASYVLQAGAASGSSALANSNVGNVTSYTATGVGAGTYYVRVVAANASGQSAASNEVVVTVGSTTTAGSLTGSWVGLSPDGFIWDASSGNCDLEHDMQLTLTQTGATLSGAVFDTVRKAARSACTSKVGVVTGPWTVTGTAGAGTLTLSVTVLGQTLDFSGTFTNTRMALSGAGGLATLTLNRQ